MNNEIPSRLRWACRRGMLELDVLLGNFLEEAYLKLTPKEQKKFLKLLDCNDQDLFDWLTGKKIANDKDILEMVKKVRQHAQSRH